MDIQLEKATLIQRIQKINDSSLIQAFNHLLDYAIKKEENDELLEASINKALEQSEKGEGRPHELVIQEMREKYGK